MRINERGLKLVKHFEGLRLETYIDPVGIPTIGYGHTGRAAAPGARITEAEAEALLRADLGEAEQAVADLAAVPLSDDERSALISFTFNLGRRNLEQSTLLKRLLSGDKPAAAEEFGRWIYGTVRGTKVPLPGLVRRRAQERALFLGEAVDLAGEILPPEPGGRGERPWWRRLW
jgi:lysozyme